MRAWYRERDLLPGGLEQIIPAASSLDETVSPDRGRVWAVKSRLEGVGRDRSMKTGLICLGMLGLAGEGDGGGVGEHAAGRGRQRGL